MNLILFTLQQPSPTLNQNALANHPRWMSYMSMSKSTAWKVNLKTQHHHHRQKTISKYIKVLCATVLGLFSHLTAHCGFGSFVNVNWQKPYLSAFRPFTLDDRHSFSVYNSQTSTGLTLATYCACASLPFFKISASYQYPTTLIYYL